ncbi:histidine kinase [Algoriphagus resistens]|uniref:histidine kinase n=1 Tax=Algoriphagus resistens TaxID=1750590 RepID=UPI000716AF0A|nr:sensor histidine kinase [Algoriphagus resistens]
MEISDSRYPSDRSGITNRDLGITRMLGKPIEKPLYFLFLIFLAYWLVDLVATFLMTGKIDNWFFPIYHFVAGYVLIALYFKIILPDFFVRKRKILAVFSLLLLLLALLTIKLFVFRLYLEDITLSKSFLINEFLRIFHFLALTSAIWILYDNLGLRQKKYKVEMEHERLLMMHRSMKLSPHFVVNTLSVYMARIIKLSPSLTTEFSYLTSLLRYSFREFGHPNFLKEEVEAVKNYLQIQQMRFSRFHVDVDIQVADVAEKLPMPKLCLLTLVENVFFHGDYTDEKHPCMIKFLLAQKASTGGWVFTVNIANKVQSRGIKPRSGFGASSVFRVLGHNFRDQFEYTVESDESTYSLLLTIRYGKTIQNRSD